MAGLLNWLVPGAGYLWLGRLGRGALVSLCLVGLYVCGLALGGHLYGLHNAKETGLLAYVFGVCDVGTGLLYFLSLALGIGVEDQADLWTAEYGNVFLMIAGLLNFLTAFDAYDLGIGRKA